MARKVTVKECETHSHEIKLPRTVILFMGKEKEKTESVSESESDMATCMLVAITCT